MKKKPVDLVMHSANQLLSLAGGRQSGLHLGQLGIIQDGAIAVDAGKIVAVGPSSAIMREYSGQTVIDAGGKVILPGFVDPHTHLVWAGDRAAEFEMRISGSSYMDIMAAGGGIASTVRSTRMATLDELKAEARKRIARMITHGTTTAEAKSGYGLDLETEKKLLRAVIDLDHEGPLQLVPTFLGAHALPPEIRQQGQAGYERYTQQLIEVILPEIRNWWQSEFKDRELPFVDVFCEEGAFNLAQSQQILDRARLLGFPLKIHADEFAGLGGTAMAVHSGAASADHLVHTPPGDIAALGASDTVAVALPGTPFGLGHHEYTPAAEILSAGGTLALASDLNPGTSWCESMQMVIALACRYMGLTPAQAIAASTINAAAAINLEASIGSLEAGKQADILLLDAPDYRHLGYRFGVNLVGTTIKAGVLIHQA